MVDAEKIKKGLDICALRSAGDCTSCPYFENTYCNDLLASDAAEYIESLEERISIMQDSMETLEKRQEWVSVKDRMPEENVPVLVWELQGFAYVDVYKDGAWEVGTPNLAKFTHWMPIPEPPKEVSE